MDKCSQEGFSTDLNFWIRDPNNSIEGLGYKSISFHSNAVLELGIQSTSARSQFDQNRCYNDTVKKNREIKIN